MHRVFRRELSVLAVLAVLLTAAIPAMARAQEPAPSPSPMPYALASPAPDNRPVLELSLDEAVKRTLENNADIAVEMKEPLGNGGCCQRSTTFGKNDRTIRMDRVTAEPIQLDQRMA